jgi:hypothetical protein
MDINHKNQKSILKSNRNKQKKQVKFKDLPEEVISNTPHPRDNPQFAEIQAKILAKKIPDAIELLTDITYQRIEVPVEITDPLEL